jgi:hypothetical protein
MQTDHRANLDAAALAVGESLALAWAHFHLLRGLDNGRLKHPQVVEQFNLFYDRLWRAAFDSLFIKIGTLIENKRGNHSLLSFLALSRRYVSPEVRQALPPVEVELAREDSPLAKLKRWRHEAVAHKPIGHDAVNFYSQNVMTLTEIERGLEQLDQYFNQISLSVLDLYSEHRSAFEGLVSQGESLFEVAALGLSRRPD